MAPRPAVSHRACPPPAPCSDAPMVNQGQTLLPPPRSYAPASGDWRPRSPPAQVLFGGATTAVQFRATTVPAPSGAPPVGESAGRAPNPLSPPHPQVSQARAAALEAAGRRAAAQAASAPAPVVRHGDGRAYRHVDAINQRGAVAMPTGGGLPHDQRPARGTKEVLRRWRRRPGRARRHLAKYQKPFGGKYQ